MMALSPVHIPDLENQVKSMENKWRPAIKQSLSQRPKSYEFHYVLLTTWDQKRRKRERDWNKLQKRRKVKQASFAC